MRITLTKDSRMSAHISELAASSAREYGMAVDRAERLRSALRSFFDFRMSEIRSKEPELTLESEACESGLVISITDKGRPYILSRELKELFTAIPCDEIRLEQLCSEGQRLTLGFNINCSLSADEDKKEVLLDKDFTCRLIEDNDEDIIKALQCIYSHYGYEYLHQDLYRMDYFKEVLRNGRFVAAVAENKHGQVMGFGANDAHPWFPGLMEMGGLVANPIARGMGIGDMLDDFRIEAGRKRGLRGLFSTPIMPNPASQKLLSRHGFIPTGMYFHAGGPDSLGDSGDGIHPMDCGFGVYIYDKDTLHTLYAPDECREFIKDIYGVTGINYVIGGDDKASHEDTVMYFNHEVLQNLLEVKIKSIGPDYRECISELPISEKDTHIEALMLLLNLNDPLCPACYDYLRSKGFIFTGCVPGGEDDMLVMEHLKYTVDRDFIVIQPDYERILDLVYEINGDDMK